MVHGMSACVWSVMYVCAFKFIVWCGVVVCEGSGEARVRGYVRRGGDRGGVPLVYFRGAGDSDFVSLTC